MAKKGKWGELSRFLLRIGESISFRPKAFASSLAEEADHAPCISSLQPYLLKIKTSFAKAAEDSAILSFFRRMIHGFFTTRVRSFGVFFFLYGFLQILAVFWGQSRFFAADYATLPVSVGALFLGLCCSFSRGTVGERLRGSLLYRILLRPIFGIKEWQIPIGIGRDRIVVMVFFGILASLFSVFFSPSAAFLTFLFVFLFFLLMYRPEIGLILSSGLFFLLGQDTLNGLIFLSLVSFLFKCALGKRSIVFSWQDLFMLGIALCAALSPMPLSFATALSLFGLYYLASCLIRNLQTLHDIVRFFSFTAFFSSFLLLTRELLVYFVPMLFYRFPAVGELFFLEKDPALAVLFAACIPQLISVIVVTRSSAKKFFSLVGIVSLVGGLVVIRSGTAWLCAFLAVAVSILFTYRSGLLSLTVGGMALIVVLHLISAEKLNWILSVFGMNKVLSASDSAFSFAEIGVEKVGWPGVFLIVVALIYFLYECYRFSRDATVPVAYPSVLAALCGNLVLLTATFLVVPFTTSHMMLFFLLCAIPRAAYFCAKREEIRLPY